MSATAQKTTFLPSGKCLIMDLLTMIAVWPR